MLLASRGLPLEASSAAAVRLSSGFALTGAVSPHRIDGLSSEMLIEVEAHKVSDRVAAVDRAIR